jgi:3-deoxy-manno-octulosonate cytidylyltransferase (CMP-KDO synthetase)
MRFLGIIPARYASTRFPGKSLADIAGKTMIQRVYECAGAVLEHVWVATDDERIRQAVVGFGGEAVMTPESCPSGTDRCREALEKIEASTGGAFDVVINIQGDEPVLHPEMLKKLMSCFRSPDTEIATLVSPIQSEEELFLPGEVKVVFTRDRTALYFSRTPIPYVMEEEQENWLARHRFYKHVGIYAYRGRVLKEITGLPLSPLETSERLEQNRWLENGYRIRVEITDKESVGVDTPEDLERVKRLLEKQQANPDR